MLRRDVKKSERPDRSDQETINTFERVLSYMENDGLHIVSHKFKVAGDSIKLQTQDLPAAIPLSRIGQRNNAQGDIEYTEIIPKAADAICDWYIKLINHYIESLRQGRETSVDAPAGLSQFVLSYSEGSDQPTVVFIDLEPLYYPPGKNPILITCRDFDKRLSEIKSIFKNSNVLIDTTPLEARLEAFMQEFNPARLQLDSRK